MSATTVTRPPTGPGGSPPAPYRLVRRPARPAPPVRLDGVGEAVVGHRGGPLLVLGGPGTGKTTLLVEAVADRVHRDGCTPEQVLVLTFGRRAAAELRARVARRLGQATVEPLVRTFHSYAFGLLRREAAARGEPPPRLLSGPEQDLLVRELLRGDVAAGAGAWPPRLRPALLTRGFAQELRDLLLRAVERGLDAAGLDALGRAHGRDDWRAAARFLDQYAGVSALAEAAAYDPAELVRAAVDLFRGDPRVLAAERAARRAVLVDELADTDPAQLELLDLLAGGGAELVAFGDPDQSVYGFRGADPQGIRDFPDRFRTAGGHPAPVVVLDTCWRSGPVLLAATRRVAARLGGPPRHRRLQPAPAPAAPGEVAVHVLRSTSQQAAMVAAELRRAHLTEGVPWSQMAVLVRSTAAHLPALRRAFGGAGVPLRGHAEEVPLAEQAAVGTLLAVLRVAAGADPLDEAAAVSLLTGPLGAPDALDLRRLRRELRRLHRAAGRADAPPGLAELLTGGPDLAGIDREAARPARRVAAVLAAARAAVAGGGTAEEVLWAAWSASGLAGRWSRASRGGGPRGAAADRDLDAVVALFDAAARFTDRLPGAGVVAFCEHVAGQQIPADGLAPQAPVGEGVAVLTAHAAKGREWDLVVVCGVQEGGWPDLRLRGSFLGSEHLVDLTRPPVAPVAAAILSRLLEEERRLFYLATTRARRRLVVTAVASEREGQVPSRFLDDLDPLPADRPARPVVAAPRALALPALVGELRAVAGDPAAAEPLRRAAATQLGRLAAAGVRGAAPEEWYGLLPLSVDAPLVAPGQQVDLSPSRVETFLRCPLRWFLERVGGSGAPGTRQAVGLLVHALAAAAVAPDAPPEATGEPALLRALDEGWAAVGAGRGWAAAQERARAEDMVRRLAAWLRSGAGPLVAAEQPVEVTTGRARILGRVDRVERDAAGRARIVDFKTGATHPAEAELPEHPQLGVYQLAVALGAFAAHGLTEPGGAVLVHLAQSVRGHPRVQEQPPLGAAGDPGWAAALVDRVAEGMAGAAFAAMANDRCPRCPVRGCCPARDEGRPVTG